MKYWLKGQAFSIGIVAALLVAYFLRNMPLQSFEPSIAKASVMTIFFLQGLRINPKTLLGSFLDTRHHGFVLIWNFLLFPVITIPFLLVSWWVLPEAILLGICFLALVPTTVASALVMTSMAGGDTERATFAVTWSNLLGFFWTPILASLLLAGVLPDAPVGQWVLSLLITLFIPLVVGQITRWLWVYSSGRQPEIGRYLIHAAILVIIFMTFRQSFSDGFFLQMNWLYWTWLMGVILLLYFAVSAAVKTTATRLFADRATQISARFCATQKTVALGAPIATAIWIASPEGTLPDFGLFILPLMLYHFIQLILGGNLVAQLSQESKQSATAPKI